jgi:ribonuclease P protein component
MKVGRFGRRKDVEAVILKGYLIKRGEFLLKLLRGKERYHRIAVIYPKKLEKVTVKRNRIRRLFFEAIRLILKDLAEPVDCVVLIRRMIETKGLKRQDIDKLVGILKDVVSRI